ncbi:hypothetical protein ZWY2020_036037 [Hordeum vulgare]|nr:hypothetical protein ZWY2020_036037 [Hordeum vulgare]
MGMSSAAAEEDSVRGGGGDEEAMRFGNFLSLDLDDTLAWAGLRRPSSPLTAWASSQWVNRPCPTDRTHEGSVGRCRHATLRAPRESTRSREPVCEGNVELRVPGARHTRRWGG